MEPSATSRPQGCREQGKQKSIGESDQEQHVAPRLPALEPKGFDLEFGFLKPETFLDLQAPNRGEDDVPDLLCGLDGFIGEQIPGFTPFALSHHDQPQLAPILGMSHWQSKHAGAAIEVQMRVPEPFRLSKGSFAAGHLPGFALLPTSVDELVAFLPAHDKTQLVPAELPEPGTGAISPLEDMVYLASPSLRRLAQQDLLLLALLPTSSFFPTPPRAWRRPEARRFVRAATGFPTQSLAHSPACDWAD